ncbi:MAG: hypothetical protein A2Z16_16160 [Chloroflexi bacterium RBG_16_54_18]|nr:MAG: hypothetical protein A2Z16_16160 [Chloroflexi bacterium RBG_16_54_18]
MIWINHNSTLVLGIGILALAAFFLLRDGVKLRDVLLLCGLLVLLLLLWLPLRPRQKLPSQGTGLLSQIGAGLPVLLEIQSPY